MEGNHMPDLKSVIARNIVELRKSANWTQAELAQKLNYSDKAVSKWERAESTPDVEVLKNMADLFQVPVGYFFESEHVKDQGPFEKVVRKLQKRNRLIISLVSIDSIISFNHSSELPPTQINTSQFLILMISCGVGS